MNIKTLKIKELPSNQNYWFFRTSAGEFFPDFYLNGFIAYGYDKFNDIDYLKSIISDEDKKALKESFKKKYPDEKREGLSINQMLLFINTMNIGDIILIPSAYGEQLAIGIIQSDAYTIKLPESNDEILDDEDKGYKSCPYVKRRDVKWLTTIKKEKLDPHLFKLMCARNTISDASNYDMYIDRNLYPIYLKNNKIYLSLRVEQTKGISALDMSNLLNSTLKLLSTIDSPDVQSDLKTLEVKMMVESPGIVQFIGGCAGIAVLLGTLSLVGFGANINIEIPGLKYSIQSDGVFKTYIEYLKEEHRHQEAITAEENKKQLEIQKQRDELKKSLESLKVNVPEELNGE